MTIALRWSAAMLVAAVWINSAIFGVYIVLFFGGTALQGTPER
jgi:hypothetical protein